MNIIIDKDGNLYVNDIQDTGERLAACIENPAEGATIVFSKEKGMWVVGEFPTPAPALFIVTDTSGTLDKTYAEILAASQASVVALKTTDGEYNSYAYLDGIGNNSGLKLTFGTAAYPATDEDAYPEAAEGAAEG